MPTVGTRRISTLRIGSDYLACSTNGANKSSVTPAEIQRDVNLSFHMAASEADRAKMEAHFAEVFGASGDAFRQRGALTGTASEVIDQLGAYAEAGVDRVNITLRPPWDDAALQVFADEVIPAFADRS